MTATGSAVLDALYKGQREDAERLADEAALSVFEAAALGRTARLEQLLDGEPALANGWAPDGHTPLGLAAVHGLVAAGENGLAPDEGCRAARGGGVEGEDERRLRGQPAGPR